MSENASECREHALRCAQMAQTAMTVEFRATFENLANHWLRLAVELEHAAAARSNRMQYAGERRPPAARRVSPSVEERAL